MKVKCGISFLFLYFIVSTFFCGKFEDNLSPAEFKHGNKLCLLTHNDDHDSTVTINKDDWCTAKNFAQQQQKSE